LYQKVPRLEEFTPIVGPKDKFCAFKSGEHTHNKARMANFLMLSIRLRILMKNKTITTDPVESLFDYKTQNYPKLLSTFCLIE
jgi:hypothetical protein